VAILRELGRDNAAIMQLIADKVVNAPAETLPSDRAGASAAAS
jgi:hypothetical protein